MYIIISIIPSPSVVERDALGKRLLYTVKPPIMDTPIRGQPPYNGQTACPLPLSIHFYLRRRDNLQTMDKMLVPTVSIIQRFHCIYTSSTAAYAISVVLSSLALVAIPARHAHRAGSCSVWVCVCTCIKTYIRYIKDIARPLCTRVHSFNTIIL